MSAETPRHGARFVFTLLDADGPSARYGVQVLDATAGEARAEARIGPDGVSLGAFDVPVAPWAQKSAQAFLEVEQRAWDAEAGWGRILVRWRQPR